MLPTPVFGRPIPPQEFDLENYSGYQLGNYSAGVDVSYITGTWRVPLVSMAEDTDGSPQYVTPWVGMDGPLFFEQSGTFSYIQAGETHFLSWITVLNKITNIFDEKIIDLIVNPGDSVTFSIEYLTSGPHSGDFEFISINNSRNESSTDYRTPVPGFARVLALWIVEAPGLPNALKLPRFGFIKMTDCSAIINGVNGGITSRGITTPRKNFQMNSHIGVAGAIRNNQDIVSQTTNNDSSFSAISVR